MPKHDFLVIANKLSDEEISKVIDNYCLYNKEDDIKKSTIIDDDIVLYLLDTLSLVKCKWPNGNIENGLAYTGYSLIYGMELNKAKKIFESWENIFNQGDEEIILTGQYYWEDYDKEGEYEKLVFNKNELVKNMIELKNICNYAYNNDYCILHLGI